MKINNSSNKLNITLLRLVLSRLAAINLHHHHNPFDLTHISDNIRNNSIPR